VQLAEAVKQGLSAGYSYEIDTNSGVFNGEHYDFCMKNLVCNHVALVNKPRVEVARLADSNVLIEDIVIMKNEKLLSIISRLNPSLLADAEAELEKEEKEEKKAESAAKDKKAKDSEKESTTSGKEGTKAEDDEMEAADEESEAEKEEKKAKDKKAKDKKAKDNEEEEKESKAEAKDSAYAIDSAHIEQLISQHMRNYTEAKDLCEKVIGKTRFAADAQPEAMFDAVLQTKNIASRDMSLETKRALLQYMADQPSMAVRSNVVNNYAADNKADSFEII
jgi:hypothetical protein